jgi:hypothetical protein
VGTVRILHRAGTINHERRKRRSSGAKPTLHIFRVYEGLAFATTQVAQIIN